MITVEKFSQNRFLEIINLSVKNDQKQFTVSDVEKAIRQAHDHEHIHLILSDNKVVGFFILDTRYSENYDFLSRVITGYKRFFN